MSGFGRLTWAIWRGLLAIESAKGLKHAENLLRILQCKICFGIELTTSHYLTVQKEIEYLAQTRSDVTWTAQLYVLVGGMLPEPYLTPGMKPQLKSAAIPLSRGGRSSDPCT